MSLDEHFMQKLILLTLAYFSFVDLVYATFECKSKRVLWTREINSENERKLHGFFNSVFKVIKDRDHVQFHKVTRMGVPQFNMLLNLLKERLRKCANRKPIEPECRLVVTLMYLAHGAPHQVVAWAFRMGVSTVREIILETCQAIWEELSDIYVSAPNEHEWKRIADDFLSICGMPNCIGAIDGKHVAIKCPPNAGSLYYNYKGHHSVVLLAACDANYCFTAVDVGAFGSQSDGGIFALSSFGKKLLNGTLNIPADRYLPNTNITFPHYFVADAAFPLKRNLMRPYPGRALPMAKDNFNSRLSRARRVIENTFGIMVARWRILLTTINAAPENVDTIIKAIVVLHNMAKMHDGNYCPDDYIDRFEKDVLIQGLWRKDAIPLEQARCFSGFNASRDAFALRDILKEYFISEL